MAQSLQQDQPQQPNTEPTILDVREQQDSESISTAIAALRTQVLFGLYKPPHTRTLPTLLLYDERGLRFYEDLTTYATEYYPFAAEQQILADHAKDIIRAMGVGSKDTIVVELGAGSLQKTSHVLLALADAYRNTPRDSTKTPVTYYALDLERRELLRTLNVVSSTIGKQLDGKVEAKGMWGTYDGGLAFIRSGGFSHKAKREEQVCKDQKFIRGRQNSPVASLRPQVAPRQATASPARTDEDTESDLPLSDLNTVLSDPQTYPTSFVPDAEDVRSRSPSPTPFAEIANHPPLHFLFLGSSIGNFERSDAVEFLKALPPRAGSGDTLLLGLDQRNDPEVILRAYNDSTGYTTRFLMNGLRVAERVLKGRTDDVDMEVGEIFPKDGWEYHNQWNEVQGRNEGYYKSLKDQVVVVPPDVDRPHDPETLVHFKAGELISFEHCHKYSDPEALSMFAAADLRVVNRWQDNKRMYSLWLLERPAFAFPLIRTQPSTPTLAAAPERFPSVPTLAEWSTLWSLWDNITLSMIPKGMLHTKPIDLRHKCLFYLGHIPAFLDIHLTRILRKVGKRKELEGHTEPVHFKDIFERGIDPHVDDPNVIHPHSEVPTKDEDWPSLEEVLAFRDRVRARLIRVYEEHGTARPGSNDPTIRDFTRQLGRVLWMTWEHEAFHAETLLYMLIQKAGEEDGTVRPSGFLPPVWDVLACHDSWAKDHIGETVSTVTIEPTTISLGHDDSEADDLKSDAIDNSDHEYGWDNERPQREAKILKGVKVETRPILNGEYLAFWEEHREGTELPASWVRTPNNDIQVRTVYGPVPMSVAKNWPFISSYDDIIAFAQHKGGRLPTELELRAFMDSHLGSDESNIGFRNWHPIPPKSPSGDVRGHNGGVWEWTSTNFDTYEGFESSALYPGYSSDFFDGKHMVVLGGSWATAPRLAQRRTLRNWYQHNYPFAWVGGRVAYDI